MSTKPLKAYEVRDNDEGHCVIQFSTGCAAARRDGANELNIDWESVESCVRKPEFDSYAPGPVPALVLIEHGWRFECYHCGSQVSDDMDENEEGIGSAPVAGPRNAIFCNAICEAEHAAEGRQTEAAKADLLEVFLSKFPGAKVELVHVYAGRKLEAGKPGCFVVSSYPGATYQASWDFGDDHCNVPMIDVETFKAWRAEGAA
jgi:hypothetical protein